MLNLGYRAVDGCALDQKSVDSSAWCMHRNEITRCSSYRKELFIIGKLRSMPFQRYTVCEDWTPLTRVTTFGAVTYAQPTIAGAVERDIPSSAIQVHFTEQNISSSAVQAYFTERNISSSAVQAYFTERNISSSAVQTYFTERIISSSAVQAYVTEQNISSSAVQAYFTERNILSSTVQAYMHTLQREISRHPPFRHT